jgi:hypothetical protein
MSVAIDWIDSGMNAPPGDQRVDDKQAGIAVSGEWNLADVGRVELNLFRHLLF